MAQHKSAKKRIRQTARRRKVNKSALGALSALEKKLVRLTQKKEKGQALEQLKVFQAKMDRSVQKGLQAPNKVNRKKSQLTRLWNNIGAK